MCTMPRGIKGMSYHFVKTSNCASGVTTSICRSTKFTKPLDGSRPAPDSEVTVLKEEISIKIISN